jgi:quinolinate synthase
MPTLNAECSLDLGCPIEEFTPSAMPILTVPWWFTPIPLRR